MTLSSYGATPLQGSVRVAGDKSISHRALLCSALALGTARISGLLMGEDVLRTKAALEAMGVSIVQEGNIFTVTGVGIAGLKEPETILDMGNAGTGVRLLMGVVSTLPITVYFTGDASLVKRPMKRVLTPLSLMGVNWTAREDNYLPIMIKGTDQPIPIRYELPVASAQVKSAILLAGLNIEGKTTVIEHTPTRDHTERMLNFLGANVQTNRGEITIEGSPKLIAKDLDVPADPSSAAFAACLAAMIPGSSITLQNILINPARIGLYHTLEEMGADICYKNKHEQCGEEVADIEIRYKTLTPIEVPADRAASMIDEYPILSMVAASINGTTIMRNIGELRIKESDRLSAIIEGLTACGVKAYHEGDDLIIEGTGEVDGDVVINTYMDHRIAMSFLVLGAIAKKPITIDEDHMIQTSYPSFKEDMQMLGLQFYDK